MKNNKGFTLVEMIISIAIIALMTVFFWTNLHQNYRATLRQETERLAASIRQTRALAIARVPEKSTGEYPAGGYGVHFYNDPPRYIIFAEMTEHHGYTAGTDVLLKEGFFDADITEIVSLNGGGSDFWFRFRTPNDISTDIGASVADFYVIGLVATDYRGNIRLGEYAEDGFLWTNMGVSYDVVDPDNPSAGGGGGKIQMESN